jgi:hypothetical protein
MDEIIYTYFLDVILAEEAKHVRNRSGNILVEKIQANSGIRVVTEIRNAAKILHDAEAFSPETIGNWIDKQNYKGFQRQVVRDIRDAFFKMPEGEETP